MNMKAIQVESLGGPGEVKLASVKVPEPGARQVLIEVYAAGVNFPDLLRTRGMYQGQPTLPFVLGGEVAGVVVESGVGSTHMVGERVAALTGTGGFAEYAVADDALVLRLPDSMEFDVAAAMPGNLLTADFALRERANLRSGQTLLIHGAAGGLGSALVQLGLAMGAEVLGVVSNESKAELVHSLGATHVIKVEGFSDAVRAAVPAGVDIIADPVGGDRVTDSIRSLARYGQLLVLGFTAGQIPAITVSRLLQNNVTVSGIDWSEAVYGDPALMHIQWSSLSQIVATGKLNPPIYHRFPITEAGSAVAALGDRRGMGKMVIDAKRK